MSYSDSSSYLKCVKTFQILTWNSAKDSSWVKTFKNSGFIFLHRYQTMKRVIGVGRKPGGYH